MIKHTPNYITHFRQAEANPPSNDEELDLSSVCTCSIHVYVAKGSDNTVVPDVLSSRC